MSELKVNAITDASGGNTASINGATPTTDNLMGRNRVINGDMRIDQRNAGASVTVNNAAALQYSVDRFYGYGQTSDGVFTLQQDADVPSGQGFRNSLKATVTTADASIGATQLYQIGQRIEGFNVADLGLGTASAAQITFSFWVRSSLTGTFGGALQNGGQNRSYPFSFSISAANTWEKKTITLTGDTTGTWLTTNGTGLEVIWGLGVGSTYLGTANAWSGSYLSGVTGQTQVIATNGATLYITGVQLEAGSVATSFERVDYSEMLRRCQRYYFRNNPPSSYTAYMAGSADASNSIFLRCDLPVAMRANPTFSQSNTDMYQNTGSKTIGAITNRSNIYSGSILVATSGATSGDGARLEASGGLGSIGYVDFSAEL